ncbi:DHS-like NAD/FAD-binding domain-containing protein [Xylariaceae sp. FL0255]|nr:DHS-like NAD/FAD-binding domain-containing protein [Xylariaceae sp. FL0255]
MNKGRPAVNTRDLFHQTALSHPSDGLALIKVCNQLFQTAKMTRPTEAHRFIKDLRANGRLVRNYTQNIDGLEETAGLSTDLSKFNFASDCDDKTKRQSHSPKMISGSLTEEVGCVQLHGSLLSWDERRGAILDGKLSICDACPRTSNSGRPLAPGHLRPDILLYGEPDPRADSISEIIQHDLSLDVDLLLIFGTSLAVHGIRELTKKFARLVHKNNGKVLSINREGPVRSQWNGAIDYWVEWDCDAWVCDLKRRNNHSCSLSTTRRSGLPTAIIIDDDDDDDDGKVEESTVLCTSAKGKKRLASLNNGSAKRVKGHSEALIGTRDHPIDLT